MQTTLPTSRTLLYAGLMGIHISVDIDAPLDAVWAEAAALENHVEWMRDAAKIDFIGEQTSGVGTVMEVLTVFGPLRTTDIMEVTEWEDRERIGVKHAGVVTGTGAFELTELSPTKTRFTWAEDLEMPWYFGGSLGRPISQGVLKAVWRTNLRLLKERVEASVTP